MTCQFSTCPCMSIERMEKNNDCFGLNTFRRLPSVCHKPSAMIIPVLVDRVIRYFFSKLYIQFPQTIYPLQFLISFL